MDLAAPIWRPILHICVCVCVCVYVTDCLEDTKSRGASPRPPPARLGWIRSGKNRVSQPRDAQPPRGHIRDNSNRSLAVADGDDTRATCPWECANPRSTHKHQSSIHEAAHSAGAKHAGRVKKAARQRARKPQTSQTSQRSSGARHESTSLTAHKHVNVNASRPWG